MILTVREEVFRMLAEVFRQSKQEEGFILGSTSRLDCLDCCEQIPAVRAGMYFYEPDAIYANEAIRRWAKQGICFCGFIHSHITDQPNLSEADIEFAKCLFQAYCLAGMWFGLAVVYHEMVVYKFYWVTGGNETEISIKEMSQCELQS